jgi:hypothetical protein
MLLSTDFRTVMAAGEGGTSPQIRVVMDDYESKMKNELREILHWMDEKKYVASHFRMTPELIQKISEELREYPRSELILRWVRERNGKALAGEIQKLWQWMLHENEDRSRYMELRESVTALMNFEESLSDLEERYSPGRVDEQFRGLMDQTRQNMEKIEGVIREAISRIPNWHGYPVVIEARPSSSDSLLRDRYAFAPAEDASVSLESGQFPPEFSLFFHEDGTIHIDDILEGGDTEFFTNLDIQTDYFNLINEILKPNSTQKTKILTLYTARPVSDRKMLESTQKLPVNLFLTNSFDHALGLASDLAGSQGMRDVWRVRMDSRYLTMTLDGSVKYYQITVPDAPVKSLELVYAE